MAKKHWLKLLGVFLIFGIVTCHSVLLDPAERIDEQKEYQTIVAKFHQITVPELKEKQAQSENFYLYIGRGTCPHCRRFVKQLQRAKTKSFYYLDSEKKTPELVAFREAYKIKFVPYFGKFTGFTEEKVLQIKKNMTAKEIENFNK